MQSRFNDNQEATSDEPEAASLQAISEEDTIKITEQHLDSFTKLLAIPLPLIVAIMVALATTNEPIEILGTKYPRDAAEMIARCIIALIFAQCCLHLTVISSLIVTHESSVKLKRSIAWHPGPCNPFFLPPSSQLGVSKDSGLFHNLLLGRLLTTQLAVGFSIGFAEGFRIDYSPGMLSHWYRLGGNVLHYFDLSKSNDLLVRAHDYGLQYLAKAGSDKWGFDTVLALLHFFMVFGIAFSISYVVEFVCESCGDRVRMLTCLGFCYVAGLITAFIASTSL